MVLLNSSPHDYRRLFVLVVDTLNTVWKLILAWNLFHEFIKKMLRLILFSNSSLANCKTKNIKVLHSDVSLCRVNSLFLDILLKTARLCEVRLQKCGAANFVPFFSGTPCIWSFMSPHNSISTEQLITRIAETMTQALVQYWSSRRTSPKSHHTVYINLHF